MLSLTMSLLCISSCYEDKGNYDYQSVNKITISGIEKSYTVGWKDVLTVKPIITSSIPGDEENYTYEWIGLSVQIQGEVQQQYVFGTEKNFNQCLNLPGSRVDSPYKFYLQVTDNKTGVASLSETFEVNVVNDIATGFVILSNVNDETRLDFINYKGDSLDLTLDILSTIESVRFPDFGVPISLACYSDRNSPVMNASADEGQYAVSIQTSTGAYRLRPKDFTYSPLYNLSYMILGGEPDGFVAQEIVDGTFLRDNKNNQLYYNRTQNIYWTSGIYVNQTVDFKPVVVAPQIASFGTFGCVMYDVDKKSFFYQKSQQKYAGYYSKTAEKEFDGLLFKLNGTGKDLVYLFGRSSEGTARNKVYTILKDPITNDYYLGAFTHTTGEQAFYVKISHLMDIANSKQFDMVRANPSELFQFLYYRTDNKIYVYNTSDGTNQLVYTAADGEIITSMKFVRYGNWRDDLMISTYDPAKPFDSCGKLELKKITPLIGTLEQDEYNQTPMSWTGFGKIVDVDWKAL